MRVLVTGVAGPLGSNQPDKLLEAAMTPAPSPTSSIASFEGVMRRVPDSSLAKQCFGSRRDRITRGRRTNRRRAT